MTISRCSELRAMLVEIPLRMIGRSKARLGWADFLSNIETELLLTQDVVNVRVMDGRMYSVCAKS